MNKLFCDQKNANLIKNVVEAIFEAYRVGRVLRRAASGVEMKRMGDAQTSNFLSWTAQPVWMVSWDLKKNIYRSINVTELVHCTCQKAAQLANQIEDQIVNHPTNS